MTQRKGFGERYQDLLDMLLAGAPGEFRLLSPAERELALLQRAVARRGAWRREDRGSAATERPEGS